MLTTRLGRSGARVSRIALGTMNFGPVVDAAGSFELIDRARDLGVTFIDTADVYGGPPLGTRPGHTEELLGEWFATRLGARDEVVLATKVHGSMGPGDNDRGLSALHIRSAVESSLRRLRTDRIDLLQLHHIDRDVPPDETLAALDVLQQQGKVVYTGSSNFAGWDLARFSEQSDARGFRPIVTEQSIYNLACRTVELEVVPAALHYGVGLLPWSPLAGGRLGGILSRSDRHRSGDPASLGSQRAQIGAYEQFARDSGVAPGTLALAWLLHQPAVTAPVVGPRTIDQLDSAVAAVDVQLDATQLAALDAIWPGPGGAAPEAYAW